MNKLSGDTASATFDTSNAPKVFLPSNFTFVLCFAAKRNCSAELAQFTLIKIYTFDGKNLVELLSEYKDIALSEINGTVYIDMEKKFINIKIMS